jgi:tetratricopeptide (TPR) repeat protein
VDESRHYSILIRVGSVSSLLRSCIHGVATALVVAGTASAQVPPDTAQRPTPVVDTTARRDTAITPRPDQARGVDAELRAALYDIATDRALVALNRLEFLRSSPMALTGDSASRAAVNRRQDLLFLLAQTYYRLGVGERFRTAAQDILNASPSGRYAGLLRLQLMVDAYRRGDYGRATELATGAGVATDRGLTALIAGLIAYNQGNVAQARTSFASAMQSEGPFTPYARYMDAIAMVRTDTSQTAAAVDALRQVAGSASGDVADHVRLTAAQLAYAARRYDDAISLAGQIDAASGLGAQALLTRAWAQFRANQLDAAAASFTEFATRYPKLPERDEARVLAAQIMLQQGRAAEAERLFEAISDSLAAEVNVVQGRAAMMSEAARALVTARAAGLLFLNYPAAGKTLALPDAAGADVSVLAAVFADSALARVSTEPPSPDVVTLADVEVRLDTVSNALGTEFPRRVMYVAASTENLGRYAQVAERLAAGDVSVAMAQLRLQEQLDAQQLRVATLQRLQEVIATERSRLDTVTARLTAARDSLQRISQLVDDVAIRVRDMLRASATETRELAQENLAKTDSTRAALGAGVGTTEGTILQLERATAEIYIRLAQSIEQNADSAVRRHPVVALRDSLQRKQARALALVDSVRTQLDATQQIVAAELSALEGRESERVRAARAALAAAQAALVQGEAQVMAVVDAELRARAGRMIAQMRKDAEAADFGSASASFFQVVEPTGARAAGTQGRAGGIGAGTVAGAERSDPAPVTQASTPR